MIFLADTNPMTFALKLKGERMMKITDKYIDVLTEGEWWDYIPDDSSDMELRLLKLWVKA